ncbi:hypothetical protein EYZ11_006921 [Aspergillus tanneri]|uniref:Uncharacterized protein n=1 Tax=Aspergillus tanneri TaxID=1220188 RepID=A0A4S3JEA1_9EURO|nr:hypothetical protein EYZ11_006921 [Aspergillus tanneri]
MTGTEKMETELQVQIVKIVTIRVVGVLGPLALGKIAIKITATAQCFHLYLGEPAFTRYSPSRGLGVSIHNLLAEWQMWGSRLAFIFGNVFYWTVLKPDVMTP